MGVFSRLSTRRSCGAHSEALVKTKDISAKNESLCLRANFGAPDWLLDTFVKPGGWGRRLVALLQMPLVPFMKLLFRFIQCLPWKFKHVVVMTAWKLWLAVHRALPSSIARRGISDSMSAEGHALHNVLWWGRLFPMQIFTMRFALSQLSMTYPPTDKSTEWVDSKYTPGLRNAYLHLTPPSDTPPRVLMWAFGGAYISGDVEGNRGLAEHYARSLGCDAFLVDMRLCPEHTVQDAVLDLYRGYEWLLQKVPAENIILLGISSGGGSSLRMLQLAKSDQKARQEYFGDRSPLPPALPQPAGLVLIGPFVDYTEISESMQNYITYDWVVSPSVFEAMLPLRPTLCGGIDKLRICSPLYHSMEGLCPMYISVSEHECLIDEDTRLAARAREGGVDVSISTRPFMCHVYQFFSPYLPEAAEEEAQILDWVKTRGGAWS